MRRWIILAGVVFSLVLVGSWGQVVAQGSDPDFKIDWCVIENGQQAIEERLAEIPGIPTGQILALLDEELPEPGYYDVTIPVLVDDRVSSLADLLSMSPETLGGLRYENRDFLIFIEDRGVNCRTGDPHGVVRLWDDKMTMVIFRDINYDISFYRTNGQHIHTTPFWMLVGPFEPEQFIDEYETIGGTLRLYYLQDDVFQMRWYAPDGGLALAIPFTYPNPCVETTPGDTRVCQE